MLGALSHVEPVAVATCSAIWERLGIIVNKASVFWKASLKLAAVGRSGAQSVFAQTPLVQCTHNKQLNWVLILFNNYHIVQR